MKPIIENTTVCAAVNQYGKKLIGVAAAACTGGFDHDGRPLVKGGFITEVSHALSPEPWLEIEVDSLLARMGCHDSEQITLFWPQGGAA